jgi:hypothetical protein
MAVRQGTEGQRTHALCGGGGGGGGMSACGRGGRGLGNDLILPVLSPSLPSSSYMGASSSFAGHACGYYKIRMEGIASSQKYSHV